MTADLHISKDTQNIYNLVHDYCEKAGLFESLQKSLLLPEKDRFDAKKTSEIGLSVLHAVHCIVDKNRTLKFLEEIESNINQNDLVLEAGLGTGIMSFAAALKAKKVLGIEINKDIFDLAQKIKDFIYREISLKDSITKIEFVQGNAINFSNTELFSVLISENIYTGMFYEKQVQISNALQKNLLPGYKAIPSQMISYVSLAETQFPKENYADKELFVPLEHNKMNSKHLSSSVQYNVLDFTKYNNEKIYFSSKIKIESSGKINSLYIKSDVCMPSGKMIHGVETTFFNNDIIIAIKKPLHVKTGDSVVINFEYMAGDNPHDIKLKIEKTRNQIM